MKNNRYIQVLVAVLLSVLIGLTVLRLLNGSISLRAKPSSPPVTVPRVPTQVNAPVTPASVSSAQKSAGNDPASEVKNRVMPEIENLLEENVLILTNSLENNNQIYNIKKLAEYYGASAKTIHLDQTPLSDELLHGPAGHYYRLIFLDADALFRSPVLLNDNDQNLLAAAVETGGANLLLGGVDERQDIAALSKASGLSISGVYQPVQPKLHWRVSAEANAITRQLSGQSITSKVAAQSRDKALLLNKHVPVQALVTSSDIHDNEFTIFAWMQKGAGAIFIDSGDAGQRLDQAPLENLYYAPEHFSEVLPLMMALRYALGDAAWHTNHHYANLIIDDPALTEPFQTMSYLNLLKEMTEHNFHTTIAFIPKNHESSQASVINLFLSYPDRFSLVQHGNNHDGYEFYKYAVSNKDAYVARPLGLQELDIQEGLRRMQDHQQRTRVPFNKIMVFPEGISPEPTLKILKAMNYMATINGEEIPLDVNRPNEWDFGMYPANLEFENFPVLLRRHPGTYNPFTVNIQPFLLDLFIGKPALFYSHADQLFKTDMTTFNQVADLLNQSEQGLEWRSPEYIVKHLYLERTNADNSIAIWMFSSDLVIQNETDHEQVYHVIKWETQNVPILSVTANNIAVPYRVANGSLKIDLRLEGNASTEILIQYGK